MLKIEFSKEFIKNYKKIKDTKFKEKIRKQIKKIASNPEVGKPMRYERKSTREIYLESYRISYIFFKEKIIILILDIYHKDKQ